MLGAPAVTDGDGLMIRFTSAGRPEVAPAHKPDLPASGESGLPKMGCTAVLLLLASARGLQRHARGRGMATSKKCLTRVVCSAAAPLFLDNMQAACYSAPKVDKCNLDVQGACVAESVDLVHLGSAPGITCLAPSVLADTLPGLAEAASCSRRPACFIGGARRSHHRTQSQSRRAAYAAASARTSRRACGAKLQLQQMDVEPVQMSFDSSRLRREIQNGTRGLSPTRVGHRRESQVVAMARDCRVALVFLKATDFHQEPRQHIHVYRFSMGSSCA